MNILQSLGANKTILNVALGQITSSMAKDGIAAIVIVRNPLNIDEDNKGLDIKSYREEIGILTGNDLVEYKAYLESKTKKEVDYVPND